ncbi:thioredoxin Y2, chloroplastic-like [Salvia miltiorrhiza]|uniref:thioredoxin Y2, chloroplastic-like n=1 Tax=Salvia miltiorrhiza TaxID=226208 RepID=UPI0025AC4BC8|nr:thioredoxin Y2, chloroplastic-like [Salvia miltiorrhiza]XP_057774084.1 thioredoxin Y2, chloroplastic-like [Salvia miltiorrhiza]XP_057774093.1 thioredoxin Y2, chloroplastic-like [Salvia miltiorrhiza]
MAISLAAAVTTTAVRLCPPSSPDSSKLSHFSSLQFPSELRNFRSHHVKSRLRRRTLALVASKNQTFSSFDELLEKSNKPVLVDFYATWCGPCQFMVPVLEQVSASLIDKIQVVKIDTEKYPAIADKYQIQALPTFILFKDGKPFDRFEGAMGADQLIERVEASLQVKQ